MKIKILVVCIFLLLFVGACVENQNQTPEEPTCNHVWPENYSVVAPTEEKEGARVYSCVLCGAKKSVSIPMLEESDDYFLYVTPATCEENGSRVYMSDEWGEYTITLPALGHLFGETPDSCTATCVGDGEDVYKCKRERCEKEKREVKRALGHTYISTVIEGSCYSKGYTEYECSRCHDVYTANETDYVHQYEKKDSFTGNCTEKSYETYECALCHETKIEYGDYVHIYNKDTGKCDHCGEGCEHEFVDYVCTTCKFDIREELTQRTGIFVYGGITYFGMYPQSHVSDTELIRKLDEVFEIDDKTVHSFNGQTYAVADVTAQPFQSVLDFSDGTPVSAALSGRRKHYFRFDPIAWKEAKNGVYVAINILDASVFLDKEKITSGESSAQYFSVTDGIYANRWQTSTARAFLKDVFYDMAFNDKQKALLQTVRSDNTSTGYYTANEEKPWCAQEETEDAVFLPAFSDLMEKDDDTDEPNAALSKKITDYALCASLKVDDMENTADWFLRSCGLYSGQVCVVKDDGTLDPTVSIVLVKGIVPAIKFVLPE